MAAKLITYRTPPLIVPRFTVSYKQNGAVPGEQLVRNFLLSEAARLRGKAPDRDARVQKVRYPVDLHHPTASPLLIVSARTFMMIQILNPAGSISPSTSTNSLP